MTKARARSDELAVLLVHVGMSSAGVATEVQNPERVRDGKEEGQQHCSEVYWPSQVRRTTSRRRRLWNVDSGATTATHATYCF